MNRKILGILLFAAIPHMCVAALFALGTTCFLWSSPLMSLWLPIQLFGGCVCFLLIIDTETYYKTAKLRMNMLDDQKKKIGEVESTSVETPPPGTQLH